MFKNIVKKVARYCPTLPCLAGQLDDPEDNIEDEPSVHDESSTQFNEEREYNPRLDPSVYLA